jgi:hypothetical protein
VTYYELEDEGQGQNFDERVARVLTLLFAVKKQSAL